MLFLPEIRLKKIIDSLFNYIKNDLYQNMTSNSENESYLYLLFHQNSLDNTPSVNYDEAKQILLRKESDPRYLKVIPAFDKEKNKFPIICIIIPQDGEDLRQLGDEEGDFYEQEDSNFSQLGRAFNSQFNLMTISDNLNEVLLINYILRALLMGSIPQLESIGFINPKFSIQDTNINPELFPPNTFIKNISLTASYPEIIPEIGKNKKINTIVFNINEIIY